MEHVTDPELLAETLQAVGGAQPAPGGTAEHGDDEPVTQLGALLEDLRGGSVGVPFGSTAHFSLLALLEQEGLSDEVTVINLSPDALLGAWQSGEIDAAYIWDPTLGELEADGGTRLVSSTQAAEIGAPTFDLSAADSAFAEENPEAMEQWTRSLSGVLATGQGIRLRGVIADERMGTALESLAAARFGPRHALPDWALGGAVVGL